MGSGTGTPVAQGTPALSPDANPQSNLPLENLSLTAPPPGQEFNLPDERFVTQTASELGIPDFDRGEFIFNPDLGGTEAQQREFFNLSADALVPIFRDIAPPPPQEDDIIFDAFDPPTPAPAPPPPPPQTAEQRRQDDILVQLGRLGSNLNRVQAAEERRQQRQTRDEIPNLGQNTPNPLAQVPESVIATLLNLSEQNNLGGEIEVAGNSNIGRSKTFPNVPDRRPKGRLDRLRQQEAEKEVLRKAFGKTNVSGLETLRFNIPFLDKVFTTLGASPLFVGNQTRVIDGRLTPVPVRRRAEGGRVAPPPMPRPRPEGLAATPEGEESFSFGFSLDDVNDYVNRVISGDIVSENLRNMFGERSSPSTAEDESDPSFTLSKTVEAVDIEGNSKDNFNYFMDKVAQIESSGDPRAKNKNTTARGLYQVMSGDYEEGKQGSVETALNRLKSIYGRDNLPSYAIKLQEALNQDKKLKRKRGEASPAVEEVLLKMSPQDSRDMFLGNILQQDVGNKFLKRIAQGDKEAMVEAYLKFHHKGNKNTEEYKKARARARDLFGVD